MSAIRRVYRRPPYVVLAIVLFLAMAAFYLWDSQVLVVDRSGVSVFVQPLFAVAAVVMALLFGLAIPMQIFAVRVAASTALGAGAPIAGVVLGTASMTCCAPVLIPSLL